MIASFGLDIDATKALFNTLDTTKVPQEMLEGHKLKPWQAHDRECYARFFGKYGWYSSQYLHRWLENVVAGQCAGNGRETFTGFQARGFRDLYIVAANVSRHRAEVFSATTTPNVAVADAVRMSTSIPIFFEALRFDGEKFGSGDYYADGGLYDNFPMHIFDRPEFKTESWRYRDGVNWETLGLFLYPAQLHEEAIPEMPETVWKFLTLTLRNMYFAQQASSYQTNSVDKHRTIEISDCGIAPVEFDIVPGSEKHHQLYTSGQQAVRTFFELDAGDGAAS